MANESLKAKLEAYEAQCAKSYEKTPERVGLKHKKNFIHHLISKDLIMKEIWVFPEIILIHVVYSLPCIVVVFGRCVCMQASQQRKNQTNVIVT